MNSTETILDHTSAKMTKSKGTDPFTHLEFTKKNTAQFHSIGFS